MALPVSPAMPRAQPRRPAATLVPSDSEDEVQPAAPAPPRGPAPVPPSASPAPRFPPVVAIGSSSESESQSQSDGESQSEPEYVTTATILSDSSDEDRNDRGHAADWAPPTTPSRQTNQPASSVSFRPPRTEPGHANPAQPTRVRDVRSAQSASGTASTYVTMIDDALHPHPQTPPTRSEDQSSSAAAFPSPTNLTALPSLSLPTSDLSRHARHSAPRDAAQTDLVCLGTLKCHIVTTRGLPPQLLYDLPRGHAPRSAPAWSVGPTLAGQLQAELHDKGHQYTRDQWPGLSSFSSQRGFRPALIHSPSPDTVREISERFRSKKLSPIAEMTLRERSVSLIIPPTWRPWPPSRMRAAREGIDLASPWFRAAPPRPDMPAEMPPYWEPFGVMTDSHAKIFDELNARFSPVCECRVPMLSRSKQNVKVHTLELLLFVPEKLRSTIGQWLWVQGMQLHNIESYRSEDFEHQPALNNPHEEYRVQMQMLPRQPMPQHQPMARPGDRASLNTSRPIQGTKSPIPPLGGDPTINAASGVLDHGMLSARTTNGHESTSMMEDESPLLTEHQKKQNMDEAYSSLQHNEDVAEVEPSPLIKSRLLPHQKKALGFLLMREKERNFDEAARKLHELIRSKRVGGDRSQIERRALGFNSKHDAAVPTAEDRAQDGGTVSLWKPVLTESGTIKGYFNIITQKQVRARPAICRGAILADDMGLGKTISVIALLAHTRPQSLAWSQTRPTGKAGRLRGPPSSSPLSSSLSLASQPTASHVTYLSDSSDDDSSDSLMPGPSKRPIGGRSALRNINSMDRPFAASRRREMQSTSIERPQHRRPLVLSVLPRAERIQEQEKVRNDLLEVRSRATLIVCPVSVISNWQEQIDEHWGPLHRPSVFVYQGPGRARDVREIANNDIVITTYSTLATEFSNQTTWRDYSVRAGKEKDDDEIVETDFSDSENEQPVVDADSGLTNTMGLNMFDNKKKRKRTKSTRRGGEEHPNPLQRIEWFRIVLDEAHIIKGCLTWQSRAVCNLSAQRRTALTGTPIQNAPSDLYALVRFLRLEPFSDREQWNNWCSVSRAGLTLSGAKNYKNQNDTVSFLRIQTIVKFLTLRRSKHSLGTDGKPILSLPPKFASVIKLPFSEAEKARYLAMHDIFKEDFDEMALAAQGFEDARKKSFKDILREITFLRMTCDHPDMVDQGLDLKNAKLSSEDLIREHGITRDRTLCLFNELRSIGETQCIRCNQNIDMGLDAAEAALMDPYGLTEPTLNLNTDRRIKPVLTMCLHLMCSECWERALPAGSRWPNPHPGLRVECPECRIELNPLLDVIMLLPTDFEQLDSEPGMLSPPSRSPEFQFWHTNNQDDDDDLFDSNSKKPGGSVDVQMRAQAGTLRSTAMAETLAQRPDLSSKTLALLRDLIQLSACNPASKLYDPRAPKLDHIPTPREELARLEAERERLIRMNLRDQATKSREAQECLKAFHQQQHGTRRRHQNGNAENRDEIDPHQMTLMTMTAELQPSRRQAEAEVPEIPTVKLGEWQPSCPDEEYRPLKSVVFSQWTRMLGKIRKAVERVGIRTVQLDGGMNREERVAALEAFKVDPKVEVLLISLQSGGVGLNLATSSSRAYLIDPAWNPALEQQALDRIYRYGQPRPVITIKLVMKHSIEENLLLLQARKKELADSIGEKRDPRKQQLHRGDMHQLFGTTDRLREEDPRVMPGLGQTMAGFSPGIL